MTTDPNQRYRILKRLDAGAMAEVFLGRSVSLEGFEKSVAIKRVLPSLSANRKFVNMFKDEARLSLYLNHANIVSVFEVGRVDDVHFIVMEYIEGTNLRRLYEQQTQRRRPMPVPLAIYIAIEVCKGLEYAHSRSDSEGVSLNIVHRDVSPPNILLSHEGEVKLTDFGLAKAKSQVELTDPGVVKGKFSYLSPEAAWGSEVDHRADIYATGIVLWELLAGQRLFLGETDIQTLELVREGKIPSLSELRPEVDAELDAIVARALAKDLGDRYQQAREMGTALSRYLANHGILVTSFDLASHIQGLIDPNASAGRSDETAVDQGIQHELNRLIGIDENSNVATADSSAAGTLNPMDWDLGGDEWAAGLDMPELDSAPAPPPAMAAPARPPASLPSSQATRPQQTIARMAPLGGKPDGSGPPLPPRAMSEPAPPPASAPPSTSRTVAGLPALPTIGEVPQPQATSVPSPSRTVIGLPSIPQPGAQRPAIPEITISPELSRAPEPEEDELELSPLAEMTSPLAPSIQQAPPPGAAGPQKTMMAGGAVREQMEQAQTAASPSATSTPQAGESSGRTESSSDGADAPPEPPVDREALVQAAMQAEPNPDAIANREALAAREAARAARAARTPLQAPEPERTPQEPPQADEEADTRSRLLFFALIGLVVILLFLIVNVLARS